MKLFHPDRFADDPVKMATYTRLTGAINAAKDSGDLETLRQIADDPAGYVMRHGWTAIDLGDTDELEQLQKLFNSLEGILSVCGERSVCAFVRNTSRAVLRWRHLAKPSLSRSTHRLL